MRRYWILVIGALVAVGCVRLGVWQLSRLGQRRALRALVEGREGSSPLDLAAISGGADSLAYRPVFVRGTFDFAHQVVVVARVVDEVPAVYVVTPLRYGDRAVLVERGWVPSPDAYVVGLDSLGEPDTAMVAGVLVPVIARSAGPASAVWPLHVQSDDPRVLSPRFPYVLLPFVLRRTRPATAAPAALRPIPAPAIDNGPHLSYVIQWFSFALIALVGSAILFRKEGRTARGAVSGGREAGEVRPPAQG